MWLQYDWDISAKNANDYVSESRNAGSEVQRLVRRADPG